MQAALTRQIVPHLLLPARQEVTAPVDERRQRGGIFNVQKHHNEKLMTSATETGQNLIVQNLITFVHCDCGRAHVISMQIKN